ncbi:MAG: endonuclease [Candidatus Aenigmarchaeota archaeon]|nr:endonuclease [Candidatus Aenigmarchaeota archaeon]
MQKIYKELVSYFSDLHGWWPMTRNFKPKEWEVCVGAILTQNTNWKNVEKALDNLAAAGIKDARSVAALADNRLEKLIQPAGFYKQKAERLKLLAEFFIENKNPDREKLLAIKGIGPETADSILLYVYGKPYMPVDAYTRRVLQRMGKLKGNEGYEEIRHLLESSVEKNVSVYKKFHAGFVELAKKHCMKKPVCKECPLAEDCEKH